MPEENGRDVTQGWRTRGVAGRQNSQFFHDQNCPGLKNVLKLATGRNFLILDIRFCGTNSMSPGFRSGSSSMFREDSMDFRFRTRLSTTPAITFRNRTTCECFACSVKPPAIATASDAVIGERSSYLPGRPTWPPTRKKGFSKSFRVAVITGSRKIGA